jgi:hypothetical protein
MKAKQTKPSQARSLKTKFTKANTSLSMKAWLDAAKDDQTVLQRDDWRFNKRANTKADQKRIGRTRKRVKSGGKVKVDEGKKK